MQKQVRLNSRLHSMDALRAITMFLGVVLHAAMSYQLHPRSGWPQDSHSANIVYDFVYQWIHSFRMPLFFLIAGFFTRFLYLKIGHASFLKHRIKRILIPFLVGLVLIVPITAFPFHFYNYFISNEESFKTSISLAVQASVRWNGVIHLWFLYYLIIFYSIFLGIKWLLEKTKFKALNNNFTFLPTTINIIVLSVLLFVIQFLFLDVKVEPWTGIKIKWSLILYYGLFYFVGYAMQRNINSLQVCNFVYKYYLIIGTCLSIVNFYLIYTNTYDIAFFGFFNITVLKAFTAIQTNLLLFGMLGFFMTAFEKEQKLLRYFSDASYWVYLIHLPIVVGLQVLFLEVNYFDHFKFGIILLLTTIITLVTYHAFVRYSIIGIYLHGERQKEVLIQSIKF
ncbi:acyltransferase family protein [Flexithrix dorotheae]|uniref:acyltransferase family protein n=1 Tax=Flexithrix dorotheae TaxID=70993 RepID=UPI00037EF618|nr:acyltransferase family protein [Flexithrix dorotheae]